MYQQLLMKHFGGSVPEVMRLPIPPNLRGVLRAALLLHNPKYPRHFLNGCYFFLHDTGEHNAEEHSQISAGVAELIHRQVQCSEERWRHLVIKSSSQLSKHLPFNFKIRVLGWTWEPSFTDSTAFSTEGSSLVMSLRPAFAQKIYGALRCYNTQISSKSRIIDGTDYFCSRYPAKSMLCDYEQTLAWVCGDSSPVGYIQYISLENDEGESEVLITGLAIEEAYQRRGFAHGLISSVICKMSHCKEIWISVSDNNEAALQLYLKCGFVIRTRQWDSFGTMTTPGPM